MEDPGKEGVLWKYTVEKSPTNRSGKVDDENGQDPETREV